MNSLKYPTLYDDIHADLSLLKPQEAVSMSDKKRGIMLKNLNYEDEGMQELINPVPLEMMLDDDADMEIDLEMNNMVAMEDEAVRDVIDMLEDTINILEKNSPKK
jgi:hypothetical protein